MTIMTGCMRPGVHAYPEELTSFIFDVWEDPLFLERLDAAGIDSFISAPRPDTAGEDHLDLLPGKPAAGRGTAGHVPSDHPRPAFLSRRKKARRPDLHRFQFARPRPFNEYELHRLAPAADFYRTLIGDIPRPGGGGTDLGDGPLGDPLDAGRVRRQKDLPPAARSAP